MKERDLMRRLLSGLIVQRLQGERLRDPDYCKWAINCVREGIGGFIVFGGSREPLREFISQLQSISETKLFIASDIESGLARQIKETTTFTCQMALASALYPDGEDLLIEMLHAICRECHYVGINMPLIPVLDLNTNPDNPIISTRAFSDKPEVVSWFAERYARVFQEHSLIGCGKHFPGHGDTSVDSHLDLPVISKSMKELFETDLVPFVKAIETGIGSIMVGHLKVSCLDDSFPASLSKEIIDGLLRKQLGFNGLVITDAMNMMALRHYDNIYSRAIMAGVDVILHPEDFSQCVDELLSAYEKGLMTDESIHRATTNVLRAKERLKSINAGLLDIQSHSELSAAIYKRSVTLIKSDRAILPVGQLKGHRLFVSGEFAKYDISVLEEAFRDVVTIDSQTEADEEIVFIGLFTTVAAWHGNSGLSLDAYRDIVRLLKKAKSSVIISFGSPYVLRQLPNATVLIAAYEPSLQAQKAVIDCLVGKIESNRNLPVDLRFSDIPLN